MKNAAVTAAAVFSLLLASGCIAVVKKDVTDLSDRVSRMETELKALADRQEPLQKKVAQVEGRQSAAADEAAALVKEKVQGVGKRTGAIAARLETRIAGLESKLGQVQTDQGAARSETEEGQKKLETLAADLGKRLTRLEDRVRAEPKARAETKPAATSPPETESPTPTNR